MGKYKSLLKNIGILTIGQFGTKILSFLLLPLYTNILTTEEYGLYDYIITTISLLAPIVTLNISVSAHRFTMDKDADFSAIAWVSAKYAGLGICGGLAVAWLNHLLQFSRVLYENKAVFIALLSLSLINTMMVDFAVGAEKIMYVSLSGVLSTLTIAVLNIALLVYAKLGVTGYFIAHFAGGALQFLFLFFALGMWRYFRVGGYSKKTEKEMLQFSVPQIANNVSWWINNASDRYVVTFFCGAGVNGIYSVGYKIPSILNIVQGIFAQAWGLSAVKNFNQEDEDGFFSKTYELYNFIMVMTCSGLIVCTKEIARVLFRGEFYQAWRFVPFLLLSSVFGAMSGYLGGFFSARKEAKLFAKSTMIGAACNFVLNIALVSMIGAMGAAVSTAFSYFVIWVVRYGYVRKNVKLHIDLGRNIASYLVLLMQSVFLLLDLEWQASYLLEGLLLICIGIINRKNVRLLISFVLTGARRKK